MPFQATLGQNTYLVFVCYVFEKKDEQGTFINSTEIQLICNTLKEAKQRALGILGDETRQQVFVKTIIEKFINDKDLS